MPEKTIAAIATALGESSISVIRISGDKAITIADKVFSSYSGKKLCELPGYQAAYGEIKRGDEVLDDCVALVFKAPKSYTGEDVVELSLHGGNAISKEVLRLILSSGAVMAAPGEFTKRAFLNGKTDLTRAESIMGLISAKNNAQLRLSRASHIGKLSKKIENIEASLLEAASSIAVFSDYPDEDIDGLSIESFGKMLSHAEKELEQMLENYDAGRIIREGVDTVIVGKPNVGKSTLMNMLSGTERSIVTDIAGTTRDIIEDTVTVGDIVLRLADTAGIHQTENEVEKIGVIRANSRIDTAELILAVFDSSQPLDSNDFELIARLKGLNTIAVINKTDLQNEIDLSAFGDIPVVKTSAKQGEGYSELSKEIGKLTKTAKLDPDTAVLLGERQRSCADRAYNSIKEGLYALRSGCTLDAVGVCIDDALNALFELTGKRVTNEVTDEIFKRFCVGK